MLLALAYIQLNKPALTVLESVAGLYRERTEFFCLLLSVLDSLRDTCGAKLCLRFHKLVNSLFLHSLKDQPGHQSMMDVSKLSKSCATNLRKGLADIVKIGGNPDREMWLLNISCSVNRSVHKSLNICPCITRTRGAGRGFWLTARKRWTSLGEKLRLMGLRDDEFPTHDLLSDSALGAIARNAAHPLALPSLGVSLDSPWPVRRVLEHRIQIYRPHKIVRSCSL